MSTWDFDGVSASELARICAGKTKPLLRLIGAPYWASLRAWGNRLQDVIELERMERSWCGDGIEILAEGDAYPRPRFACPANLLEGFDMAMRATGVTDGIHKYVLDYASPVTYEDGYVKKHLKNKPLYEQIERGFSDKTPRGVRVYEYMTKFEDADVPACYEGSDAVLHLFFSQASRLLSSQSIPTVYEGLGTVGIAFGENAKYLEEGALENGLILDILSAQILQKMGVDVGLVSVGDAYTASMEYFPKEGQYVALQGCAMRKVQLNPRAVVLSEAVEDGIGFSANFGQGASRETASYVYTNAQGQSFLVFAFEGYSVSERATRHYARGAQIEEFIRSLGKRLPAVMLGNPDCYMLCKENEKGKAVWIGNFFADECLFKTVTLDRAYEKIEFIGCTGRLLGDRVEIDEIPPYASVGFIVE
jgi:hypothetical protein